MYIKNCWQSTGFKRKLSIDNYLLTLKTASNVEPNGSQV